MRSACCSGSSPITSAICYAGWPCPSPGHPELVADELAASALQDRRPSDPTCPVLHPAVGRKPVDSAPICADHPAHRAARVASDVIEMAGRGGERETERSWREYLSAGWSPRANLRKMGRQPRGRRGDSPCDAFRTAEGTRGASRGPFSTAREARTWAQIANPGLKTPCREPVDLRGRIPKPPRTTTASAV